MKKTQNRYHVFVYGTLLSGEANHFFLSESDSMLINAEVWAEGYEMFDNNGWFPFAARARQAGEKIKGEIWAIDEKTLNDLDQLEGVSGGLYERIFDQNLQAYLYVKPEKNREAIEKLPKIMSGNWRS
jgi:gamma-glutamylcyclotransferase (GGCT)/AIG2-like uncharacterized protein YtfP